MSNKHFMRNSYGTLDPETNAVLRPTCCKFEVITYCTLIIHIHTPAEVDYLAVAVYALQCILVGTVVRHPGTSTMLYPHVLLKCQLTHGFQHLDFRCFWTANRQGRD